MKFSSKLIIYNILKSLLKISIVAILICVAFSMGVEHQAKKEWLAAREYKPMFSSRIVVKNGDDQVVAYTIPRCDSIASKDDGYWLNKYVCDPESFIVVEDIEWPFKDECTN